MYDDRADANEFKEGNIAGKIFFQLIINHGMPAVFDYDGHSAKALNIRQGFNQNVGNIGFHRLREYSGLNLRPS